MFFNKYLQNKLLCWRFLYSTHAILLKQFFACNNFCYAHKIGMDEEFYWLSCTKKQFDKFEATDFDEHLLIDQFNKSDARRSDEDNIQSSEIVGGDCNQSLQLNASSPPPTTSKEDLSSSTSKEHFHPSSHSSPNSIHHCKEDLSRLSKDIVGT